VPLDDRMRGRATLARKQFACPVAKPGDASQPQGD
jgi:hypothetical protein